MAPITRRTSFPKVLIEKDSDSEQSSSDEEQEEEEILVEEENGVDENAKIKKLELGFVGNSKGKTPITLSLQKVCKVTPLFFFFLKKFHFCCEVVSFFLMGVGFCFGLAFDFVYCC